MTMKKFCILCFLACCQTVKAGGNGAGDSCAVVTNSFWDNWFVQAGVDMWLQNPHGKSFKDVFPNGKTFGIDVAAGKWVTPEFGFLGNLNWENGIIKSDHAKWIHEGSKSYMVVAGDILINLTNLVGGAGHRLSAGRRPAGFQRGGAGQFAPAGSRPRHGLPAGRTVEPVRESVVPDDIGRVRN